MRRWALLLAIAGCEAPAEVSAPARSWAYAPPPVASPLGGVTARLGRGQAPQAALGAGIEGAEGSPPLRLPTPWQVPGEGPARAIVYGTLDGADPGAVHRHAVELIDIDQGRVLWRDTTQCAGPVAGVTAEAVVCADGRGVRAIGLDGKRRWNVEGAALVAMTRERVVLGGEGEAIVLDAADGQELARVKLPLPAESVIASCGDAGRELFAYGQDAALARVVEKPGGARVAWTVPVDGVASIDACDGTTVLVVTEGPGGSSLVALSRETGARLREVTGVRGHWPARDGSDRIEVSTLAGVARYSRDLASSEHLALPSLGELLAQRGPARLVRATPRTAALLDARGVAAFVPLAQLGAALGERSILAASWRGSPGETVRRIAIPARYPRALRLAAPIPPVAVPAELRDLPAVTSLDAAGVPAPDLPATPIALALDPRDPGALFVVASPMTGSAAPSAVARFDLTRRAWSWSRVDGCAPGTPVSLAIAGELVVCASRGSDARVRATATGGAPRWEWRGESVDRIDAAGELVLVHDADRLLVLDATNGRELARLRSDDGMAVRAAALALGASTLLVTAERDRVVARLARVQLAPAWSIQVAGVVAALEPAGDGVLVLLEDGDAYRVAATTGEVTPIPGLGLSWHASGELIAGGGSGGPIPPSQPWPPADPPSRASSPRGRTPRERDPSADPPELPRSFAPPPDLRASWQLTLYELTGALRARNDYALDEPVAPAAARSAGAPLVVQSGAGLLDLVVIEPTRGDPQRRVRLPDDAASGLAFSTVVNGAPMVGALRSNPLRVVLF